MPYPRLTTACPSVLLLLFGGALGCQSGPPVESHRLIQHQALIDFSGLKPVETMEVVRVQASVPSSWSMHAIERHALYSHQQWKNASNSTGVGVVYARLPLPIGTGMLLWLGRQQYAKTSDEGREIGQWTDELGRRWFEAETKKFHARGYAIVDGLDAWIVYFGYKVDAPPEPADISLAARCVETFVPIKAGEKLPPNAATQPAAEPKAAIPATQPTTRPAAMPAAAKDAMQFLSKKWAEQRGQGQ
jgi:hypothetical protein